MTKIEEIDNVNDAMNALRHAFPNRTILVKDTQEYYAPTRTYEGGCTIIVFKEEPNVIDFSISGSHLAELVLEAVGKAPKKTGE